MPNSKEWWETKEGVWGVFFLGVGVGDMLGRLTSIVGFLFDVVLILLGLFYVSRANTISRKSKVSEIQQPANNESNDLDVINPNISKISNPEPHNQSILDIVKSSLIPLVLTLGVFIGGIVQLIIWIIHKASFNPLGLILFIGCYWGIPIMIWYSTLFGSKKQRQTGISRVYSSTLFTYKADNVKEVFNRCFKVLDIMKAEPPTQMEVDFSDNDKQAIIKRPIKTFKILKPSNMVVIIRRIQDKDYNIDVSSDAQKLEAEWDFGKNKKNINTFKKLMLSKKL